MTPKQIKALHIFLRYVETLDTDASSQVYNAWEILKELDEEQKGLCK